MIALKVMKRFIVVIVAISFPTTAWSSCTNDFPHYELFENVLTTLIEDYWSPDGNWKMDMMHDATAFAPYVLLHWGTEIGDNDLVEKGWTTVSWADRCFLSYFNNPFNYSNLYRATMGYPAYLYAYEFSGSLKYLFRVKPGLKTLNLACLLPPKFLKSVKDFPPPTLAGMAVYGDFLCKRVNPHLNSFLGLRGMHVIQATDERYFNEETGLYECDGEYVHQCDWPNGMMLVALSWAFMDSGIESYLESAERLAIAIDNNLWDPLRGGYYTDIDDGEPRSKYLSGNMVILWGFLSLYEANRDPALLERIEALLSFVESDLFYEGLCYHHWTEGEGRSSDFCTGCNFLLLNNLYNYHKLSSSR
jgi:hypothetical protein